MINNKTEPTKTVLTICVGFIMIYLIFQWNWAIYISFSIGLIGIFSSYLSSKINFLWMKLSWLLSLIIPNIVLGIFFYLYFTPYSLIVKLFSINKNSLDLKNKNESTFICKENQFNALFFEKPW